MIEIIGFGVVATLLVLSALRVVLSQDLVHSVLWLAVMLASTAVLYLTLSAPFLAGIQLLLYTGGVITLMLFGVMLTNRETGVVVKNESDSGLRASVAAATLFGIMATAIYRSGAALPDAEAPAEVTTAELGRAFLTDHLLAFEVLSVLLLAAMIGAIALARRTDFGAPEAPRFAHGGTGRLPRLPRPQPKPAAKAEPAPEPAPETAPAAEPEPEGEVTP